MSTLKSKLQEVALEAVEAMRPVKIYDGIYIGDSKVKIEPQLDVTVLIPEAFTDHKVQTDQGEITVFNRLNVGDHLLIGRYHKEMKYVVLARLKSATNI